MAPSPGYIQGYLPGVRENGGQYTHAALWTVLAFARLGDGDRAAELFSLLNPVNHGADRRGRRALPRRTVRRRRGRLLGAAAHRARRVDVVHRIGRLDVSRRASRASWASRCGSGALHIDPCIPRAWPGYEVTSSRRGTPYRIVVENPDGVNRGVKRLEIDGVDRTGQDVPILNDGAEHHVRVVLG